MISGNLNLKQLEALIWVADLGSFRKAAAHLNTTQPNISTRIAALEIALGVTLMQRDAGSVRMTMKGKEILAQARVTLRSTEELINIAGRPDLIEDHLRLGVTELVAHTWLRDFLRRLKEVYPRVAVELNVDLSSNLDKELAAKALDLTIQNEPFQKATTGEIGLGAYEYAWVGAPEVAAGLATLAPETTLWDVPILTHARHTQAYLELVERFGASKARFVPSSSLTSCIHMALDGMGVAVVPEAMIAGHITDGTLQVLPMNWHPTPLKFSARFHADKAANFVLKAAELAAEVADAAR